MDRLEKQYIIIKYIEYVRIYNLMSDKPYYFMADDERVWAHEVMTMKEVPIIRDREDSWFKSHIYEELTDMFDLSHHVKIDMAKKYYAEMNAELTHLDFMNALRKIKQIINTLEIIISYKLLICCE